MKTKLDIINETVEYYSVDPSARRSVSSEIGDSCKYFGNNGNMCAFARYVHPDSHEQLKLLEGWSADVCLRKGIKLKDEVQHHSFYDEEDEDFWVELQMLHDNHRFWNSKGLSELGIIRMEQLRRKYENH